MKPLLILILLLLAVLPVLAELPQDLHRPEFRLQPGGVDASWQRLLAELQGAPPLRAEFEERRYFPFRRDYTALIGEIRLDPAHGLSLHYSSPQDQLMVVDARGGFMQNERGRRRELPDNPSARAATSALLHVLRFDLGRLAENFEIYAAREADRWAFAFIPRPDGQLAKALSPVTVRGEDGRVQLIEMRKSERQRVEIHVGATETGVSFTEEELARYFR